MAAYSVLNPPSKPPSKLQCNGGDMNSQSCRAWAKFSAALLLQLFSGLVCSRISAEPMNFEIFPGPAECTECAVIMAKGDITPDSAAKFEAFIDENSAILDKETTVIMNSPGGSLMSGLKIGEIIRSKGFDTYIGNIQQGAHDQYALTGAECASACSYAFLGGLRRSMHMESMYGLHQISSTSDTAVPLGQAVRKTQDVIAELVKYVEEMGGSAEIVTTATSTADSDIKWVSDHQMTAFRIVNSNGLFRPEPWKPVPRSIGTWSTRSILPDGSESLLMMRCDGYSSPSNTAGNLKLSITPSKRLPSDHPRARSPANVMVRIDLDGKQYGVDSKQTTYGPFHGISSLEIPISLIRYAFQVNGKINIRILYPDEFAPVFAAINQVLPLDGLGQALDSFRQDCPSL